MLNIGGAFDSPVFLWQVGAASLRRILFASITRLALSFAPPLRRRWCVSVYMCVCMYIRMCIYSSAQASLVCVYVCVYVCMYTYVCIHTPV
jgi:hypothetical protein